MRSPCILRVITAVYLATVIAMSDTGDFVAEDFSALPSIKKFLNTTDPIWTYNSSERTTILCKVDQNRVTTEDTYSFNWSYYHGYLNWTTLHGEGKFQPEDTAKLNVSSQEYSEELLFTDKYETCAIILVTPLNTGSQAWYEHLVKNSSITKRKNKNCTNFFQKKTTRGRKVYRSRCLRMLNIGNATYSRWELH
uniref:Putative lipocalin n=1 Tax=Rhipicephalus microplus TaxID=6941 RepID=A0A6G5A4N0_RHIMP